MATHRYLNEGKDNLIEIQYRLDSEQNIPNPGDYYIYKGEFYTVGSRTFDTDRGLILIRAYQG